MIAKMLGHSVAAGVNVQLAPDALDVSPHCGIAHREAVRDLLAGEALREETDDLAFPRREASGIAS